MRGRERRREGVFFYGLVGRRSSTEENVSYSLRGWHAGPGGRRWGLAGSWKAVSPKNNVIMYRKLKDLSKILSRIRK